MNAKACINSLRLRTLPLSLSGVIAGSLLSINDSATYGPKLVLTIIFLLLTTSCLQLLSNLSNELGDTLHGTDADDRQGKIYSLQNGELTIADMHKLIRTMAILCCIFGALMIYFSFGTFLAVAPCALLLLGTAAIWAAIHYTLGKDPYGYKGGGDISVFIFFGLVSVCGGAFVLTHEFNPLLLLPGSAIGAFSVGVLNINNIRDMKSDARTRVTTAIRLGEERSRIYQSILLCGGWILMLAFTLITGKYWQFIYCATLPLFAKILSGSWKKKDAELDPLVPLLVISTFLFALLLGIGNNI